MFGHNIPKHIVEQIVEQKDLLVYAASGKLTAEPTDVPVARVCCVADVTMLSDENRQRMEVEGVPCVLIENDLSRCKEYFPSRYFENPPYEGRPFIHGLLDCYTLFRDWYERELGVRIPWNIQRPFGWWENNDSLYFKYMREGGFKQQSGVMQRGDVILFALGGAVTNHVAVYLGGGEILHHLGGRFSCREALTSVLNGHKTAICRYVGNQ